MSEPGQQETPPPLKRSNTQAIQGHVQRREEILRQEEPGRSPEALRKNARRDIATGLIHEKIREETRIAKENSFIDGLTGLKNRRWFTEELTRKVDLFSRISSESQLPFDQEETPLTSKRLALIIFDMDKFKQINDGFGHVPGDRVLRLVKDLSTRPTEEISRYGGEEFTQLIEIEEGKTLEETITAILERHSRFIKEKSRPVLQDLPIVDIEKYQKDHDTDPQREISFSYGVALYTPGESAESFFERADQALNKAKGGGRDRGLIAYQNYSSENGNTTRKYKTAYIGNPDAKAA